MVEEILPELLVAIYRAIARPVGTTSGGHGIGHKRKDFMELVMGSVELDMMRSIKRTLDPTASSIPARSLTFR